MPGGAQGNATTLNRATLGGNQSLTVDTKAVQLLVAENTASRLSSGYTIAHLPDSGVMQITRAAEANTVNSLCILNGKLLATSACSEPHDGHGHIPDVIYAEP